MRVLSLDIGTRNLGVALVQISEGGAAVELCRRHDCGQGTLIQKVVGLADGLAPLADPGRLPDYLVLEQQPVFNQQMFAMQAAIAAAFGARGMPAGRVACAHPSIKDKEIGCGRKVPYKERKARSEALAAKVLERAGAPEARREFEEADKRDDIADAVVQALAWAARQKHSAAAARQARRTLDECLDTGKVWV